MDSIERRTMRKVYLHLLPFCFCLYLICYLDRANIGFAALTMNKDLGLSSYIYGLGAAGEAGVMKAIDIIRDELDTTTSTLILGHISESNNHPEIVRLCASQALRGRALFTRLVIADPRQPTETFTY